MSRNRKEPLERLADLLLLDAALAEGAVESTKNKHGFGKWMRERGMLHPSWESDIAAHEKTGFLQDQLESLDASGGADRQTRERYRNKE